jgi:hypothetical protein
MSIEGQFEWNALKSAQLKLTRGVSFEDLVSDGERFLLRDHPRRAHQKFLLIYYLDAVWVIPCVPQGERYFLKTLYRSRKYTRLFKGIL